MLRTLAINSNQIVLSFGVLIAFLSPKQSEIEESSLESISKSIIQGVWDPAHSIRLPPLYIRLPPLYIRSPPFHPDDIRNYAPPPFHPDDIRNSAAAAISTWMTSEILLPPPFHPDVLHPEFNSRMGEEGVSTSPDIHIRIL